MRALLRWLLLAAPLNYDSSASHIIRALRLAPGERIWIRHEPGAFDPLVQALRRRLGAAALTNRLNAASAVILLPLARPMDDLERDALALWLDQGGARREIRFHGTEALAIDYKALAAAQDRAAALMRLGTVRIHTPAGTDFMFRIGERHFNRQNGDASPGRARAARLWADREIELPAGALRVAPIEETANGNIVLPEARFGDTMAARVVLQVDNGRVTRIRAEQGQAAVEAELGACRFGSFSLGFNASLAPPGDGAAAGVVGLTLGDNHALVGDTGGPRRTFYFTGADVHVDFRYLVRDGRLEEQFSAQ